MKEALEPIPLARLALAFIPVCVVLLIVKRWSLPIWTPIYATVRMFVQLMVVGLVLRYLFETTRPVVVLMTLMAMSGIAAWIAIRPLDGNSLVDYLHSFAAILIGSGCSVLLATQLVFALDPWWNPTWLVPLAGMGLTAGMNCISLAAERYQSERQSGLAVPEARQRAMQASLITVTNSLLAVGIVSIPGLMTGQILAGTSPQIASQYQIVIMCMFFGGGGTAAAVFLALHTRNTSE